MEAVRAARLRTPRKIFWLRHLKTPAFPIRTASPMAEMLAPLLKAATRIQWKVKFQNQVLEVDDAKEFNLTLHERWLEMQQFLVRWYWLQFSAS